MLLYLWKNFNKRSNSTKLPGTPDASLNVKLKEDTSIETPSFILSVQEFEYNYAQAFGHYYFINDIVSLANGLIQINCKQDVLATYKSEILNTTAYVEYSATRFNHSINDSRISSIGTSTIFTRSGSAALFDNTGYYVLSAVSTQTGAKDGFAVYYVLDSTQVTNVANDLAGSDETIIESLVKKFGSAYNSVISCKWIPFNYSTVIGNRCASASTVILGNYGCEVIGTPHYVTNSAPLTAGTSFASIWGNDSGVELFKRVEPYTHISAYLPYYGMVNIPTLPVAKYDKLQFDYGVDFITGDVTVRISTSTGTAPIMTLNYNVAVDAPVAQVTDNSGSIATVIAGLGAAAVTGGATAPAAVGAISGALQALTIGTSVKGSISGRSYKTFGNDIKIVVEVLDTTDPAGLVNVQGRPLHEVVSLSSLTGYVQTVGASVNMAGLANDKTEVNSLLNSGIYIE